MRQLHPIRKSILTAGVFLLLLLSVHGQNADIDLLRKINPNPPTSGIWKGVSKTAKPLSIGIPVAMFVVHLATKNENLKWKSAEAVAALGSTIISTQLVKIAFDRQRPYQKYPGIYPYEHEDGKSLPSGHASIAFSTATTLALEYKKWYIVVPAYAWATSVGYSRLYLGMHYPTDVLVSAALGAGSAWLTHVIAKKLLRKYNYK
jgi:undecaprenyl-diphosphatase